MTSREKWALGIMAGLLILLGYVETTAPRPVDWSASFSKYHDKPFGAKLVFGQLHDIFPEGITVVHDPIYLTAQERLYSSNDPVNHIFINSGLDLSELDTENLMDMVANGDDAFIASQWPGSTLLDSLHLGTRSNFSFNIDGDTVEHRLLTDALRDTTFHFTRNWRNERITSTDTLPNVTTLSVLAISNDKDTTFVRVPFGEGNFWLCTTPHAFTNFNLLKDDNALFMSSAFSFLPNRPVLWDEFYKVGRMEVRTPLRYILAQAPLKWAYFCTLALVILFMLFRSKREQRAIPIVEPPRNASRQLVSTIGRLYFQKGDHPDLAKKMIAQFKDDVRRKAYWKNFKYDGATIAHLAAKTGMAATDMEKALMQVQQAEVAERLGEEGLLQLKRTIDMIKDRL